MSADAVFVLIKSPGVITPVMEEEVLGVARDMGVLLRWVKEHAPHHSDAKPSEARPGWIVFTPPERDSREEDRYLYYIAGPAMVLTDAWSDA